MLLLKKFTGLLALLGLLFISCNAFSQDTTGVNFSYSTNRISDSIVVISLKGKISPGIKVFALQETPDDALYSTIQFDSSVRKLLRDSVIQKGNDERIMDTTLQSEVHFFKDSVDWQQKVFASPSDSFLVKGKVSYMTQKGEQYLPYEKEFKIFVLPENKSEPLR